MGGGDSGLTLTVFTLLNVGEKRRQKLGATHEEPVNKARPLNNQVRVLQRVNTELDLKAAQHAP